MKNRFILDDRDIWLSREASELLAAGGPPHKAFYFVFFLFNLLMARGVYYNLTKDDLTSVLIAAGGWCLTMAVLSIGNDLHKKYEQILN